MVRELESGQVDVVDARLAHAIGQIGLVHPEPDSCETRAQHDGQRRPPASGANRSAEIFHRGSGSLPRPEAETVLRAGMQPPDILAMPVDDERRRDDRRQQDRQRRALHNPNRQRKGRRRA